MVNLLCCFDREMNLRLPMTPATTDAYAHLQRAAVALIEGRQRVCLRVVID